MVLEWATIVLAAVSGANVIVLLFQLRDAARARRLGYSRLSQMRFVQPQLSEIVLRAEQDAGLALTPAARDMLLIPVAETFELSRGNVSWDQVNGSIRDLMRTMADEPEALELGTGVRDSRSVIAAFARRFCNIPPFCSRTREARR